MEKKDQRTNKSETPCCKARTCHKNCPVEWDNPFCHDTFCRECHLVILPHKRVHDKDGNIRACGKCGWWACKKCMEILDYSFIEKFGKDKNNHKDKLEFCIKCQDEMY